YKNAIVNAEKDLSAPRLYNTITRSLNGTYKDLEKASSDIRKHLQPLIDLGLFDTARNILSKKGYGIEEREAIINPLGMQSQAILNQIPTREGRTIRGLRTNIPLNGQEDTSSIKDALVKMKQVDPNFSLSLARKSFEDKNYSWREFKDGVNELLDEGFELTDDQKNQLGTLDTPPLNLIEKDMHGIN